MANVLHRNVALERRDSIVDQSQESSSRVFADVFLSSGGREVESSREGGETGGAKDHVGVVDGVGVLVGRDLRNEGSEEDDEILAVRE